ncbi:hypothetical protein TRFO_03894 [Tritrichomonas foetus]|uniref:Uncharacterized protein n=1 Tax=Tritrichomonas foetus TaxID=1144522 RepID=A0A1J4KK42_9EUKA|nr:hypothetical protein TRFO_03894 [Tritrichomonas foetus]|eukprot:OHT11671.1 hypothetical protein TRFO_03894 [Tritrichomonas foetus]
MTNNFSLHGDNYLFCDTEYSKLQLRTKTGDFSKHIDDLLDAFFVGDSFILCHTKEYITVYDYQLEEIEKVEIDSDVCLKKDSKVNTIFYKLKRNSSDVYIYSLNLIKRENTEDGQDIETLQLSSQKIDFDNEEMTTKDNIIDFDVSFNHMILLSSEGVVYEYNFENRTITNLNFHSEIISQVERKEIYCDDLNFYLFCPFEKLAFIGSFADNEFISIFSEVTQIYKSEYVIIKSNDDLFINCINIGEYSLPNEDNLLSTVIISQGKLHFVYINDSRNIDVDIEAVPRHYPFHISPFVSQNNQYTLIFDKDFDEEANQVIHLNNKTVTLDSNYQSVVLVGDSIVLAKEFKPGIYGYNLLESDLIKNNDENPKLSLKQCTLLFNDGNFYKMIKPDKSDDFKFYAIQVCPDESTNLCCFAILPNKSSAKLLWSMKKVSFYSVGSQFISLYYQPTSNGNETEDENVMENGSDDEDEVKEKKRKDTYLKIKIKTYSKANMKPNTKFFAIDKYVVNYPCELFSDHRYLYVYNLTKYEVDIYDILLKRIVNRKGGVVRVFDGSQIVLALSNSTLYSQISSKSINGIDYLPITLYSTDNHMFYWKDIDFTNHNIFTFSQEDCIPFKNYQDAEFNGITSFLFDKDSSKIKYNESRALKQRSLNSMIMINHDLFIKAINNEICLYSFNKSHRDESIRYNLNTPVILLIHDPKRQSSFFALTKTGILYNFILGIRENDVSKKNDELNSSSNPFTDQLNNHLNSESLYLVFLPALIATEVKNFSVSTRYIVIYYSNDELEIIDRDKQCITWSIENISRFFTVTTTTSHSFSPNPIKRCHSAFTQPFISRIINNNKNLFIFYQRITNISCYSLDIIHQPRPENVKIIDNISRCWSNNGNVIYQKIDNTIVVGDFPMKYNSQIIGAALHRGILCIWKNFQDPLEKIEIFKKDTQPISFYNGSTCFRFYPDKGYFYYNTFIHIQNDQHKKSLNYSQQDQQHKRFSAVFKACSATVIEVNTFVFSEGNRITLFMPPGYSISFDNVPSQVNHLCPHPGTLDKFFGISDSCLYMFTFDGFDLFHSKIAVDIEHFSVSKDMLLIQYTKNNKAHFYDTKLLSELQPNIFLNSLPHLYEIEISENVCFIDNDFFYQYKESEKIVTVHPVSNPDLLANSYTHINKVFDTLNVILKYDGGFVFKNNKYQNEKSVDSEGHNPLYASCGDEVCFWEDDNSQPMIFKVPRYNHTAFNCYYNGKQRFLFSVKNHKYTINGKSKTSFARCAIMLKYPYIAEVKSNTFTIIEDNTKKMSIPEKHPMANAEFFRVDPANNLRVFAHFQKCKQLYLVNFDIKDTTTFNINYVQYANDVVKFDATDQIIVILDSNKVIHIQNRNDIVPFDIKTTKLSEIIPNSEEKAVDDFSIFCDKSFYYIFDKETKKLSSFILETGQFKNSIENVVSIWSTNGVVVQTKDKNLHAFGLTMQIPQYSNVFAAAIHNRELCLWENILDNGNTFKLDENEKENTLYSDVMSRTELSYNLIEMKIKEFLHKMEKQQTNIKTNAEKLLRGVEKIKSHCSSLYDSTNDPNAFKNSTELLVKEKNINSALKRSFDIPDPLYYEFIESHSEQIISMYSPGKIKPAVIQLFPVKLLKGFVKRFDSLKSSEDENELLRIVNSEWNPIIRLAISALPPNEYNPETIKPILNEYIERLYSLQQSNKTISSIIMICSILLSK